MTGIIVIGGGGHAKVVIETLLAMNAEVAGFCDPSIPAGEYFGNVSCLGDDNILPKLRDKGISNAIIALGDNALRQRVALKISSLGLTLINAIHPSAQISPSVKLGMGIAVMANAVVNAATTLGDNVIVNTGATVDHDCEIGTGAHIAPGSHLSGYISVGERSLVGVGSVVGRGRPLRLGEAAVVGAGSVVIEDVPPNTTVVGNPARIVVTAVY